MHRATSLFTSVLLAATLGAGLALAPTAAWARGGATATDASDRAVEREIKAQDRRVRSAVAKKSGLAGIVRVYEQRALNDGSAISLFLLGRAHGLNKDYAKGIAQMQAALARRPGFHQAQHRMAVMYLEQKNFGRAEQLIDDALRARPDNPDYIEIKANLLIQRKAWDDVIRVAKRLRQAPGRSARQAETALGVLIAGYMGKRDPANAKRVIESLIQTHPKALNLRAQWVECCMQLQQWDAAIGEIKNMLGVAPKEMALRRMLVRAYMGKKDLASAASLIAEMVREMPDDLSLRALYVETLLLQKDTTTAAHALQDALDRLPPEAQTKQDNLFRAWSLRTLAACKLENARNHAQADPQDRAAMEDAMEDVVDAVRLFRASDRIEPLPAILLDRLQVSLAQLGRHKERLPYLRRMVTFLKDRPEEKGRIEELIALIEKGGSERAEQPEAPSAAQVLRDLVKRCQDPDVEVRRAALHEYYELNLPFVDPDIYSRHDYRIESDPKCRFWVVRILGRFETGTAEPEIVRIAARYSGLALEDPAPSVRQAAAEALGTIRAPAGILYLIPHLAAMTLDPLPTTDEKRESLEREYNATRAALAALTGRSDIKIGEQAWLPVAAAAENRKAWQAWLAGPEGEEERLEALDDLGQVRDVDPRWQLRYILVDVIQTDPPSSDAITLKAYSVLRDCIQALPAERRSQDPWWKIFPMHSDEALKTAGAASVRKSLQTWWNTIPRKGRAPAKSAKGK